jgi:hypothetical protein
LNPRADCCIFQNFETMYNEVYEELVRGSDCHEAERKKVKLSKEGLVVIDHAHEALGLEQNTT